MSSIDSDSPRNAGYVYVLKLQDDCWYVGYSADPETRIASYFFGRAMDAGSRPHGGRVVATWYQEA